MPLFLATFTMGFLTSRLWRDLSTIQALAILSGAIPAGLLLGFFGARRISAKCGAAGVYRRKPMSLGLVLLAVFVPVSILSTFLFVDLYLLFSRGIDIWSPQVVAAFCLAAFGFILPAPLGTILFERHAGFRLWILGTPSVWLPDRIEYRRLAIGVPPLDS